MSRNMRRVFRRQAFVARDERCQSLGNKALLRLLAVRNIRFARRSWEISAEQVAVLRVLTEELQLSVAVGDLRLLDGKWYVTHAGLLRVARRNHCSGIRVQPLREFCDPAAGRWVFRAMVYKSPRSREFVGYGDADPSNVSSLVHGAELRVAETRAVNRALRKAYGIGLCSVEELGSFSPPAERAQVAHQAGEPHSGNGQPRLRDRLCQLIRQHQLDPTLVKRYATDLCGTTCWRDEQAYLSFPQSEGGFLFLSFAHLARAAFRALALLCSGVSLAARVFPPFEPPILPKATACGFFLCMACEVFMPGARKNASGKKALDNA